MNVAALRQIVSLLAALCVCSTSFAQDNEESDEDLEEIAEGVIPEDAASGSLDDSTGSVEGIRGAATDLVRQGWQLSGDLRIGYIRADTDLSDGTTETTTNGRGRFRFGGVTNLNEWLLFDARIATSCTTDECDPGVDLDDNLDSESTLADGTITFDELYLHAFRLAKFDIALGRLQTKFVARSGVFAKSLDRNNSNGFNVNWTDGVHGTYHFSEQSIVHFIAEYNSPDGPSSIRHGPLDFSPSSTRTSYFVAWESQERLGPFTQRGFDISYLPSALIKDGIDNEVREDYVGLVARYAMAKPFGTRGRRWNVAGEFGYAAETPTEQSVGLAGDGDADGFAWNVMASLMDLWPDHSIGINYGRAGAGWLLSPQYRDNEELVEIRYLWRRRQNLAIDVRLRWRQQLETPVLETERVNEVDFFARFTLGFTR